MSDLPSFVHLCEEGPREGFQIEKSSIPTADKIALINALSTTGLRHIQLVSFVDPARVPGMADADNVVAGITPVVGVKYTGIWFNERGFERAIATGRLHIEGSLFLSASESFLSRNQNRTMIRAIEELGPSAQRYLERGYIVEKAGVSAAFGCNFEGDIPETKVLGNIEIILKVARDNGITIRQLNLLDTMGWATPLKVKRLVGAVRAKYPDLEIVLHLHDTRGMAMANAFAGLEMGVARYDAAVAGLGGCPFAGHKGAAGNICTEDLVFLCHEMGIDTGVDLDTLIECALLAERIVGHPLPGSVMKGGTLSRWREARQSGLKA